MEHKRKSIKIEVLFKARCAFSGEWRYGYYYPSNGNYIIRDDEGRESIVLPNTLCQYIGVEDKNGVKIFTGDKVRYETIVKVDEIGKPISYIGVIEFWKGQSGVGYRYKSGTYTMMLKRSHTLNMEVVGNTYDDKKGV